MANNPPTIAIPTANLSLTNPNNTANHTWYRFWASLVGGKLAVNSIPKSIAGANTTFIASAISDDGTNVTIIEPLVLTNQVSAPGSDVATLSNSPVTGNPSIWLQININGTTGYIPVWT